MLYFPVAFCLTYRLSLADQELMELLQQGRLSDNLPAHVGVPGLLIRIPGGRGHIEVLSFAQCFPLSLTSTTNEVSPAESLRSVDLLPVNLHVLNILEVFVLEAVEDFLGMAGM